jgi:hypothetical protein
MKKGFFRSISSSVSRSALRHASARTELNFSIPDTVSPDGSVSKPIQKDSPDICYLPVRIIVPTARKSWLG